MSYTRKSLADYLDSYDDQIADLQNSKREMLQDYRAQLADKGWGKPQIKAEVDGFKVALRRRRAIAKKGEEEVDQTDAIAEEIFVEITSVVRAPRATRENIEKFGVETVAHDADGVVNENSPGMASEATDHSIEANAGEGHVDRSALRASSAVKVGATNSPDGQRAAGNPRFESVHGAREAHRPATYGQLVTAGETATNPEIVPTSPRQVDVSSPLINSSLAAREVGEVAATNSHLSASSSRQANTAGAVESPPTAPAPPPTHKDGCLDQSGCRVKFTSALCSRCASERAKARVAA